MKAILFYVVPNFRLTGSTINAIEYYLAGLEHNPELKLLFINGNYSFKRKIQKVIYDKYVFYKGEWEKAVTNMLLMPKFNLPSVEFDTVLIVDYVTIFQVKGVLRAEKILVISEKYTDNPNYFLSKSLYNVEYYGEMPFHYKDHEYRMKCLFDRYRKLGEVQKGTYVNSPRNDDLNLILHLNELDMPHLPLPFIVKSKTNPEENLFEKFTNYLYYHANKWFDPHPRLFLECRFYQKPITYLNPHKIKDGSWYRYQDILRNNLHNRTLNERDEIISQL
jgi:hypothetical protein